MAKYLDGAGLDVVWGQIKNTFYSKSGGSIGGEVSLVYGAASSDQMIRFSAAGSDPQSVYLGIRRPVASYGPSYKDTAGNWYKLLHEGNYTSFTVKKDGTGASGTWGISISGNATTATTADTLDGEHLMTKVSDWDTRSLSIFKSSENSASNRPSGAGYLYGTTLRFHRDETTYFTDLVVNLYGDNLYFRRHTENGYANWRELIHSGNIGSQSVSYATSSGSSSTANSLDPESLSDLDSGTKWRFFHTSSAQPQHSPVSGNSWFNGITLASNNDNRYKQQLAIGLDQPHIYFRNMSDSTWGSWLTVLDSSNYSTYTVGKDGTGANGIWSISIYGNAATATETDKLSWYNYGRANLDDVKGLHDGSVRYILQGNGLRGLHFSWDAGNYDTQIQIPDHKYNSSEHLKWRSNGEDGTWESWMTILDSSNYTSYAATSGHTHTSLVLSGQSAVDSCAPSDAQRVGAYLLSGDSGTGGNDGYITTWKWANGSYLTQLFVDVDPTYNVSLRHRNSAGEWTNWKRFAMGDGTGATGTWGINVTGSAGSVAWGNITSRPRVFENLGWNSSSSYADADATNMAIGIVINQQGNFSSSITNYPTSYGYLVSLNPEDSNTYTGIQLYQGTDDLTRIRYRWSSTTWGGWRVLLDSSNYTTYAATASHNHDGTYLKLSGGTITTTSVVPLKLTTSANYNYISFGASSTDKGEIGYYHNGPGGVGEMYMQVYGTGYPTLSISENGNGYVGNNVILHSGNYTTYCATASHNHDGTYLKLSSASIQQSITGQIKIKDDLGGNLANWVTYQHSGPFEVGRSSNAMTVAIGVTDDNYGYIQTKGINITTPGDLVLLPGGGNLYYDLSKKPILHSGNYSNYALPLTGGRISNGSNWSTIEFSRTGVGEGAVGGIDDNGLYFNHRTSQSNTIDMYLKAGVGLKVGGSLVWTAGNDGSGSGLDADLLDGKEASGFFYKKLIYESADCNTMEDNSFTILDKDAGSLTCANKPGGASIAGGYGVLTVKHGVYRNQIFFPYGDVPRLFTRSSSYVDGVVWKDWRELAFLDSTVANSNTVSGLTVHSGRNNEANKIVRTDAYGYLQTGYINSSDGDEGNNSSPARVWGTNGSDSYLRTYLTSALSVGNASTLDGKGLMTKVTDWNTASSSIFKSSENSVSNAPTTDFTYGMTLRFHRDDSIYWSDVVTSLYHDRMFFRRHSDDGYKTWQEFIHSGNWSSFINVSSIGAATSGHNHDTVYVKKAGDTLTGPLVFQRSGGTNNYNEGIRFNLSGPVNWAGFTIGGTATEGTGDGIWAFLVNNKTLYISHNGSSSATYGLTFTNSGALNLKTSSLTNNGNTIITSANIGSQTVAVAGKLGNYSPAFNKLFATSKSVTMTTVQTYWYVKIELSAYAQPYQIGLVCSYNNEVDRGILEFSGMSSGYIYRNCCQNDGNIKGLCMKTTYDASEHLWIFWVKFDKILDTGHYSPSSQATCTVYLDNANSAFNVTATTTEPSGVTWVSTGETNSNILIKNCTIYGELSGNATSATTAESVPTLTNSEIDAICT